MKKFALLSSVLACVVVGAPACGGEGGGTKSASGQSQAPLDIPDAASLSADGGASGGEGASVDPALQQRVRDLVEDTCKNEGNVFECPDGTPCSDLGAFGVESSRCETEHECYVCFKEGKSQLDIPCPPGTKITTNFVAYPDWSCRTP